MKRNTCLLSIVVLTLVCLPAARRRHEIPVPGQSVGDRPKLIQAYGRLPLSFEMNQGQTDQSVKFLSHSSGYSLFLTGDEAVLALKNPGGSAAGDRHLKPAVRSAEPPAPPAVLRMRLVGANAAAKVTGLEELPGKSNYFIGNDPKKWRTNVPSYAKVKYENVYPGVDLVYYGNQQQLEYDFVVQPGADPKAIQLGFAGASSPRIDEKGDLVVGTDGGEVIFHKPVVYQPVADHGQRTRDVVDGKYLLKGDRVTFEVASYDKTMPLVIDPMLAYSTYLGGSGGDVSTGIAVDASGSAYVTGGTDSPNFPTTPGPFQSTLGGGTDVFVSKLNAAGSALLYSTYLGGSGAEFGEGITVDASGDVYITGSTNSSNFPVTPGAFQTTCPECDGHLFGDAFVAKLNATGSALLYSTYLGGRGDFDNPGGIAIDASGNAYVTGSTDSPDFPTTPGAFQTTFGGIGGAGFGDAFVTKLNAIGSALVFSTYLGGRGNENFLGGGIAVDAAGNVYVTGDTDSTNFPTTSGAFQTTPNGHFDAFVSKLNAAGSALVYSTYLGGSSDDFGKGIAIDTSGSVYITGGTSSANFQTTPGAFQTACNGGLNCSSSSDVFITKLNPTGSGLIYSSFLGRGDFDRGLSIRLDGSGSAWVTGFSGGLGDFPTTPAAFQTTYGGGTFDAFVSKLDATGSALLYSSYLGGSGDDAGVGALDALGNAYVTGSTSSSNFPTTPGAFQTTFAGGSLDAFVSKFSFGIPFSSFSGKLELDLDAGSFDLNASFTRRAGGSINPPTQPVSLTIGAYSVTIPAGSFVRHIPGYAFEGVINGVSLEVLIKFGRTPGSYQFLAEGRGANLKGTTNPVTVTISIGNDMGSTQIQAEFQ